MHSDTRADLVDHTIETIFEYLVMEDVVDDICDLSLGTSSVTTQEDYSDAENEWAAIYSDALKTIIKDFFKGHKS